ncbi:unnamed protein product [Euphydryas editha]|uniref:Reverse transcriptase domain-containing protein n=1 Tax=Euphydryas editha TaxID=104508 RepID=A0AAU9U8K6_EUPED|nr:unnamed protein product [Euphydryas editha]
MGLINSTTDPSRDDTEAQIQDPILKPDPSQSPIQNITSDSNKVAFDIDEDQFRMLQLMSQHFDNSLVNSQHGFRDGLSVQTNLSNFITDLMVEVDKGNEIDVIYTDFSSAFDKVDHIIVLNKLSQCGIGPCLLKWIESYLHQRPQTVVVNGFESAEYIARSGVPQG